MNYRAATAGCRTAGCRTANCTVWLLLFAAAAFSDGCASPAQFASPAYLDAGDTVLDLAAADTATAVPDDGVTAADSATDAALPGDLAEADAADTVAADSADAGQADVSLDAGADAAADSADVAANPGTDGAGEETSDALADASVDAAAEVAGDAGADTAVKPVAWTLASAMATLESGTPVQVQELLQAYDMPLCAADACLFLVQAPQAKTVVVIGDWGSWTQGNPLAPAAKAKGWFSGKIAIDHTKVREYKVQLDGTWAIDPSNPHFRFGGFGPNSAIFPMGHSRLRWVGGVVSPQLGNTRSLYVYLPAAYFSSLDKHFPVLYWHDGFNVFTNPKAPFGDWKVDSVTDALIAEGALPPLIQVAVDTDDRMSEYVWAPLTFDKKVYPPKIIQYAAFLVDTVKPLIDKTFRTLPSRDHTALAGSSLGGNASLWIGWHHWQVFGRIASFSGALWVGEGVLSDSGKTGSGQPMREIIAANTAGVPKGQLRIYLDSGDRDFDDTACYECDSWVYSDWTRNALIAAGWANRVEWDSDGNLATPPVNLPVTTPIAKVPSLAWSKALPTGSTWPQWLGMGNNLLSMVGHGHQHSEPAWNQRAPVALRYLFGQL